MDTQQFEQLVDEAISELPEEFKQKLKNVSVVVENFPTREQLLKAKVSPHQTLYGLYEGVPQTQRGSSYTFVLPDKITIFQKPIEYFHPTAKAIKQQVRSTVLHEIGHHFGLSELQLRKKIN